MRQVACVGGFALAVLVTLVPAPAWSQASLDGAWQARFHEDFPERIPGPELGDYLGLPITDAARRWAESWDPSRLTLPEHQCQVHVSPYIYRGPLNLRIWYDKDPLTQDLVAIRQYISTYEQTRTIWMDGRPHPSDKAPHTWMGFSTGRMEGDTLVVVTTHIKQGWIRRNGVPQSDRATTTERFIRHGDVLTHVMVLDDPVYLTEPLIRTEDFSLRTRELPAQNWLWKCQPVVEIASRAPGEVPAYMPGENPFMEEFRRRFGIPEAATRGGAETAYPEFARTLETGGAQ